MPASTPAPKQLTHFFLFLLLLLSICRPALAQKQGQALVDSLLAELPKTAEDSSRARLLASISYECIDFDTDKSLEYARQALALSEKTGWKEGIAFSKEKAGRALWRMGNFDEALKLHFEALELWKELGSKEKIALSYILIGQDYADWGHYPEALDYLNLALDGYKALGIKKNQGTIHNILAWVYNSMGMQAEALAHQYESLKIYEALNDKQGMAIISLNLASYLQEEGHYEEAITMYQGGLNALMEVDDVINQSLTNCHIGYCYLNLGDYAEAAKYFQIAFGLARKIDNKNRMGAAYSGIGDVYAAQNNDPEALKNYLLAAEYYVKVASTPALAGHYTKIGECYIRLKQLNKARLYFDKALALNRELNSLMEMNRYYGSMVQLDSVTGDWKSAFGHYKLFVATRDSMYNEENTRKMVQARMQYEFDKKEAAAKLEQEQKDALARQELQQQKLIRNGFMGGFGVVVCFAGIFFFQRNRIKKGKTRSDELLLNILPAEVAEELKTKGAADAKLIDEVTVLFSDFKEFTQISAKQTPRGLVAEINACFSAFDLIMQKHGVEKIKTVGDAYLAAGGLPRPNDTHAADVIHAALEMQAFMEARKQERAAEGKFYFEARIGIHTGPVVAGIVGVKKFAYDIWGDTVNTAQRMESNSEAGKVNISDDTYKLVKTLFNCSYRGKVATKGKGEVDMYFVEGV